MDLNAPEVGTAHFQPQRRRLENPYLLDCTSRHSRSALGAPSILHYNVGRPRVEVKAPKETERFWGRGRKGQLQRTGWERKHAD